MLSLIAEIKNKYRYKYNFKNVKIMNYTNIDKNTSIGEYTYIGENCNITKTSIGRYCSIASYCAIGQGEHELNNFSTSSIFYGNKSYEILTSEDLKIGNDVWIGTHAIIMRGLEIGDGAVIGAGAIVTKNVEPYSIVVGSPAKEIRKRFDDKMIEKIMKTKWWKYSPEKVNKLFDDNKVFVDETLKI